MRALREKGAGVHVRNKSQFEEQIKDIVESVIEKLRRRPSTTESSIQNYRYDVFISFRGADTRNTFVDHLYAHLIRKGIFVYKDDKKLRKGESISAQLLQAIRDSRLSVVVFSENYADSKWCLDEMASIVDCKKQAKQIVFPIFYHVDPSDVRYQTGVYKNAFKLHRQQFKQDLEKVVRWESAMTDLANSAGSHVMNKGEYEEIKTIVEAVIKLLGHKFSVDANDLIGIQPRVQALESILKLNSKDDDFRVLGIWGMSGIGKTTHATILYDRISHKFNACCFIHNVSKIYKNEKDGGAMAIQKQILHQTFGKENLEECHPYEILGIIKNRLRQIKVLIVLDNVDEAKQFKELGIDPKMLFKGSRMIITTTDEHILKVCGANARHKVSLLKDKDAYELFCRKAFKSEEQSSSCVELIPEVLKYAQCLPLAIEVIGSFLYTRDATQWKAALDRFKKNSDKQIMNVLQISVDELEDDDKEIFLHIACFFNGEREDYVKRILKCCELGADIGIPRITEKSLITIRDEEIHMHDMLQQLGKIIVRSQFPEEQGSWSRIWLYKDFFHVLMTEKGTDKVKAIVLNEKTDISECSVDELSKMTNLRLLILYHKSFSGSLKFLSHELRYLLWHDYPFASLPSCFTAPGLVELNMPHSSARSVWEGRKNFRSLKRMDLSNSIYLTETPDFSGVPKLEWLDISGCTDLSFVDPSIGLLEKLAYLSLRNCSNLVSIIFGSESNLCSLKVVHFSGCTKLERTPDFTSATNLEYLDFDGCTSLSLVHESIGALAMLTFLSLRGCTNLASLPNNINTMKSLQTLYLCGCSKLTGLPLGKASISSSHLESLIFLDMGFCNIHEVPDAIGELRCLERLNLQGNNFVSLPSSISSLHRLAYFNLSFCHNLEALPELPDSGGDSSGGKYFKMVSGSRDHRSGFYAFHCPELVVNKFSKDLSKLPVDSNEMFSCKGFELAWLIRLIEKPCHFRCGFDIVVPWRSEIIPGWFRNRFEWDSTIRINHFKMDGNWIGFAFCVIFDVLHCPQNDPYFSSLMRPFYLSFEREHTEEYFDIPLQLKQDKIDGSQHIWIIYISRQHCHFVEKGSRISFKTNSNSVMINKWGMRGIFKEDIDDFKRMQQPTPKQYIDFDDVQNRNSFGTKIQLPYNWLVTEEDEAENIQAKAKENNLSNVGL